MKYTNEDGEQFELSTELVRRALEIKLELQKAFNGRTNWKRVVKQLTDEGFDTEGITPGENFRRVVTRLQLKEQPDTTQARTNVDYTDRSQLGLLIGELAERKRDVQNITREFNKARRDLTDKKLLMDTVDKAISKTEFDFDLPDIEAKQQSGRALLASFADLHVGALVKTPNNNYDPHIAEQRVSKYADKLIKLVEETDVDDLYIANIGDTIEGQYMRANQGYSTVMNMSEQIVAAIEIVIGFLKKLIESLAPMGVLVHYVGIDGNHSRLNGNKKANIYGDSVEFIINELIQKTDFANSDSFDYINHDDIHRAVLDINGKNVAVTHGDLENVSNPTTLGSLSTFLNVPLDIVFSGHMHRYSIMEVGDGKYQITSGSFKGSDDYSQSLGKQSSRSQAVVLFEDDGSLINMSIQL